MRSAPNRKKVSPRDFFPIGGQECIEHHKGYGVLRLEDEIRNFQREKFQLVLGGHSTPRSGRCAPLM